MANAVNAQKVEPALCYRTAFTEKSGTYECPSGITILVTATGEGSAYDPSCYYAQIMAGIMADDNLTYAMSHINCPPPRGPELPEAEVPSPIGGTP